MMQITKEFYFDAAHRLFEYIGKCSNIHGHRYEVVVCLSTISLDKFAISVDFGIIKSLFQGWLDEKWDHKLILNIHDPLVDCLESIVSSKTISGIELPYCMSCNPTAESMAQYLATSIFPDILKRNGIEATISSVSVFETPTSSACFIVDSDV
jgi:6-pyruvoyltetrahydropterin/6-carboxytetrahydropterin synthase